MRKLLHADFARLWKDKALWLAMAVAALFGVIICLSQYNAMVNYDVDMSEELPRLCMNSYLMLCIALVAFTNLFLGTEYSDGTIRNKLVTGCSRSSIYLSGYITCVVGGLLMQAAFMLVVTVMGVPMFGFKTEFLRPVGTYTLVGMLLICCEIAIYTMVSMLCQNKAAVAVLCQVVTFALIMYGSWLMSALSAPEFYDVATKAADGSIIMETVRNESYLTGHKRQIYEFLTDFIPMAQGYTIAGLDSAHPALLGLYSVIIGGLSTAAGLLGFRKKDLK